MPIPIIKPPIDSSICKHVNYNFDMFRCDDCWITDEILKIMDQNK